MKRQEVGAHYGSYVNRLRQHQVVLLTGLPQIPLLILWQELYFALDTEHDQDHTNGHCISLSPARKS